MFCLRPLPCLLLGLLLAPRAALHAADPPPAPASAWKQVDKKGSVTLYEREHTGTAVKEVRAVGTFDAPNWMVRNVLDDADHYKDFMPYVIESRVLSRDPGRHALLTYAEINPPMVSKRDYTILVSDDSRKGPSAGETTYVTRWQDANTQGPAEKSGVVRVKNNEGSWVLEPTDNGAHTRATYTLWTDGGGGVPAFLLNRLNKQRLTELFEIVSKQVQKDQYRHAKPVLP